MQTKEEIAKEIKRCLPCRDCKKLPECTYIQGFASNTFGCNCLEKRIYFYDLTPKLLRRIWNRRRKNSAVKFPNYHKALVKAHEETIAAGFSDVSSPEYLAFRERKHQIILYNKALEMAAASRAHAFRLGNLLEEKTLKIKKLKEENDQLKAALF